MGNPFPCLFQLLEAACIPWFRVPLSIFKASNLGLSLFKPPSFYCSSHLPTSSMFKDPCDHNTDNLKYSSYFSQRLGTLIPFATLIPFETEHVHRCWELGHGHFGGRGHYSADHNHQIQDIGTGKS